MTDIHRDTESETPFVSISTDSQHQLGTKGAKVMGKRMAISLRTVDTIGRQWPSTSSHRSKNEHKWRKWMFQQTFKNIDGGLSKEDGCTIELDYTKQAFPQR